MPSKPKVVKEKKKHELEKVSGRMTIKLADGEKINIALKEKLFVDYYLGEAKKNGAQAAKLAGYSPKTAYITAAQLLVKPNIQAYIQHLTQPLFEKLGLNRDRVLEELALLAMSRPELNIGKNSPIPIGYQDSHTFKTVVADGQTYDVHDKTITFNYQAKMKALITAGEYLGIIRKGEIIQPVTQNNVTLYQQINNNYESEK